jgi:hypothetical protein
MNEFEANIHWLRQRQEFPFPDYETNPLHCMLIETYWLNLFKSAAGGNENAEWEALQRTDCDPGGPVFSAINYRINKFIRIHIHKQEANEIHYKEGGDYYPFHPDIYRYDQFYWENTARRPIPDDFDPLGLFISADLSEESEAAARHFITFFLREGVGEEELDQEQTRYLEKIGVW